MTAESAFEPKIIAFCCNWCSYAGADLAGVSRMQYPPNIRIIRVMCSGRIEPNFILRALELGADGVLVTGCHIGDCHYISGNKEAERSVGRTFELMKILGIDARRLRLEWVSASEGQRFSSVVNDFVEQIKAAGPNQIKAGKKAAPKDIKGIIDELIEFTGAHDCVECGKCTSVCPVTAIKPDFAPRLIVVKALAGAQEELAKERDVWTCMTCEMCNNVCPYKVDFSGFIRGMRGIATGLGQSPQCSQGGLMQTAMRVMANSASPQNRLGWLTGELKIADKGGVFYFTGCLPHMNAIFNDRGDLKLLDIARSAVKIMNAAGVVPVVSKEEKCCGHDLNWAGDEENLKKLMKSNVDLIKKSGAKTVVFTCPEGLRTFDIDYQDFLGDLDFEMLHISEFIAKNDIPLKEGPEQVVTYHDPCRLGRHLGIYDPPREALKKIPNLKLVEMPRSRDKAACCGVSAWVTCDSAAKKMQIERMMEAKKTGASKLITTCPKCWIHLDCAVSNKLPVDKSLVDIPIEDLTIAIARHLEYI
jgi:Fe-S oxidoreductase/coenzyme F420-reducing hydrogenase delta subunit